VESTSQQVGGKNISGLNCGVKLARKLGAVIPSKWLQKLKIIQHNFY